jgi:serine/threonine protein kinase/formylglycine-generating enzyme required for sulfatase activity/lipopolysaccharide biosynthesis regulator YciM
VEPGADQLAATLTHAPDASPPTLDYADPYATRLPTPAEAAAERLGQRLGEYRIVREIGHGGMGMVFEAVQESLGRRVALKVMRATSIMDEESVKRFRQEAEAVARLNYPNIVPVYTVGEQDGIHYYAMQLIAGVSLAQVIYNLRKGLIGNLDPFDPRCHPTLSAKDRVATSPRPSSTPSDARVTKQLTEKTQGTTVVSRRWINTAVEMIAQVADAVEHAHQHGVIHRDIKPSNLLLAEPGKLMLTDFGLARQEGREHLTYTGVFLGTPMYVSPEQAMSGRVPVDHRTDIYSLGATLYELLTLHTPYRGGDLHSVLREVVHSEPRSFRKLNVRLPPDLEVITFKALEKDPARRYPTAREFADDLRRFLNYQPIQARPPGPVTRVTRLVQRQKPLFAGIAAAVVLALVLTLVMFFHLRHQQAQRVAGFLEQGQAQLQRAADASPDDEAERAVQEALVQFTSALAIDEHNRDALDGRLEAHLQRCRRALDRGEFDLALGTVMLLKELDRDRAHAAEIAEFEHRAVGDGTWQVETDPPGCRLSVARLNRQFQAAKPVDLGVTPLASQPIAKGSYVILFTHPEYAEVRLPLQIDRNETKHVRLSMVKKADIPPGMVYVPEGGFLYGDPVSAQVKKRTLPGFFIDRTEVTGADYEKFVQATNTPPPDSWHGPTCPAELRESAVRNVSWFHAMEYARWAGKRLPTEAEWEKAARGADGRNYPWGNRFDQRFCNCRETSAREGLRVGRYRLGESPYGCLDMAGNVWEWTLDRERRTDADRVIRGGAAYCGPEDLSTFRRQGAPLGGSDYGGLNLLGFRCVKPLQPEPPRTVMDELKSRDELAEAAEYYWDQDRIANVEACVRQLLQLNPRSVPGNYWKGAMLVRDEKLRQALSAWKLVFFQNPVYRSRGRTHAIYKDIRRLLDELDKAGQTVDRAFLEVPKLFMLAETAADRGAHREAEGHLLKVLEFDPESSLAHEGLAEVYTAVGQTDEAAKYQKLRSDAYRAALLEDPINADLHHEYADFLARNDLQLEEALTLAQHAVELDPEAAPYLGTLAEILARLGRSAEAIKHIEQAIQLNPEEDAYREQLREFKLQQRRKTAPR